MKIWELEWKKINKKPFLRGIIGLAAFSLSIAMLFLFIPDEEMGRGDAMIIRKPDRPGILRYVVWICGAWGSHLCECGF